MLKQSASEMSPPPRPPPPPTFSESSTALYIRLSFSVSKTEAVLYTHSPDAHIQRGKICQLFILIDLYVSRLINFLVKGKHFQISLTLLRPTDYSMYTRFNTTTKLYVLPTQSNYVFCMDHRTKSDYFPIQH
jgi:hypothetical protein